MAITDYRLMERICRMHYYDGLSQDKIAKRLGLSRSAVSRILSQAKDEGCVEVRLRFKTENYYDLERQLEERWGLREAVVTPDCDPQADLNQIGVEGAMYLKRLLKPNMILAITWGRFMQNVIRAFEEDELRKGMRFPDAEIVPLVGSVKSETRPDNDLSIYTSLLAARLADILNCSVQSLPAPMYVKNPEVRALFFDEPMISHTLDLARHADAAVFGIGSMREENWIAAIPEQQRRELEKTAAQNGRGEIIGWIYASGGRETQCKYNDCVIGLSLEELKKIPQRIAIAYGPGKIEAVRAALNGGIANVLITDRSTALALLE